MALLAHRHAIGGAIAMLDAHLLAHAGLPAIAVRLLGHSGLAAVAVHLLGHAGLPVLGALGAHLDMLGALAVLGGREALLMLHAHLRSALLVRGKAAATTATATAVEGLGALMAAATAAAAVRHLERGMAAASASATTVAAARLGRRRGADRQCGDASSE
jgi:hypothetical protein